MQQAILAKAESTPQVAPGARARFVINLCSSTSPVALTPPDHAGLKRFTFFVSRRREEQRERFRLHMGYFETQEEAEKLLDIVREIYPGAWAGFAPGQKLRGAAAEPASPVVAAPVAAASLEDITPLSEAAAADVPAQAVAPIVAAAEVVASVLSLAEPKIEPLANAPEALAAVAVPLVVAVEPTVQVAVSAPAVLEATVEAPALSLLPDVGRAAPVAEVANEEAARSLLDVRNAIAALDGNGSGISAPVLRPLPELQPRDVVAPAVPVVNAPVVAAVATARPPRALSAVPGKKIVPIAKTANPAPAHAAKPATELDDASALKVLESTAATDANAKSAAAGTSPEKPFFAVQLLWSVQPIDVAQVPQLAIFGAYTLYGAEGNRDGRRWYGLRLGFFTDTVSAKQVAHYVRSEFSSVCVVPVTARERERAKLASARPNTEPVTATPAARKTRGSEFEFIDDKSPAAADGAAKPVAARAAQASVRPGRGAPGKRAKLRPATQVKARAKARPMTLEETLEILGAGELKMDDGRESIGSTLGNVAGASSPAKSAKPSRLGRLFEKLSERLGN